MTDELDHTIRQLHTERARPMPRWNPSPARPADHMTTPPGTEELLAYARRTLGLGQTWWVDGLYARRPAYAHAINTLEAEGYRVDREPDLVTVRQP